jgi:hypothetical protein
MSGLWLLENTTPLAVAGIPTFSPPGKGYTPPLNVSITDGTPGATIYYTLDGTTPTILSPVYGGPIALSLGTTIVQAIATASGFLPSPVGAAAYAVATPLLPPAPPQPQPPAPTPPTNVAVRVRATAAGYFEGVYRDIGDVFDIFDTSDFIDSAASEVPVGNPDYPLLGWMLIVPSSTPLFSWASTGLASPHTSPRRTVY